MTKYILGAVTLVMLLISGAVQAEHPKNMYQAKKYAKQIWADNRVSFYCGCKFDNQKNINHNSCSFEPLDKRRDKEIEWEHIVPVNHIEQFKGCGRNYCENTKRSSHARLKCCDKKDPEFRKMRTDLQNLVPTVGSVNNARTNYRFAELGASQKQKIGQFRNCPIFISKELRKVEPNDRVKGAVARTYLYFNKQYNYQLGSGQERLFNAWDKKYPMEEWERVWRERVDRIQK